MTEHHGGFDTQPVPPAPIQQPNPQQAYPPAPYQQVAPKNPGLALVASFFFPGLGTLMNGQVGKGLTIFGLYFVAWMFAFILIGIPFVFGIWVWGMVDAYGGAKKWNTAHGIIS